MRNDPVVMPLRNGMPTSVYVRFLGQDVATIVYTPSASEVKSFDP